MILNRNKIFGIGVAIIALFITINRVDFLIGSSFAEGKVVKVRKWSGSRGRSYFAPIVSYSVGANSYTFQGETYSELNVGEEVSVVYKNDLSVAEVFSFVGFVMTPLIYALLPLLILTAAIYSFIEKNETVAFSIKGITKNKPLNFQSININEDLSVKSIGNKRVVSKSRRR